uniref:Uncharacterized protein n=1 Tax=Lepeophtheirus salmonis TaxID=72036 RepID=A0A0K2UD11_LEPSM
MKCVLTRAITSLKTHINVNKDYSPNSFSIQELQDAIKHCDYRYKCVEYSVNAWMDCSGEENDKIIQSYLEEQFQTYHEDVHEGRLVLMKAMEAILSGSFHIDIWRK